MRFRIVFFTLLACAVCLQAFAMPEEEDYLSELVRVNTKLNKWSSSKYFVKGLDAIEDMNYEVAEQMFEKELKLHPSNGYAMCNLAQIRLLIKRYEISTYESDDNLSEEEQEAASLARRDNDMQADLPLLDKGLALLPSSDTEAQCQAYCAKAFMLNQFFEVDSAQVSACYEKAIAIHPCVDVYEKHLAFNFDNPDIVIDDALMLRKLNPDDPSNVKLLSIMAYRSDDYIHCLAYCQEYEAMMKAQEGDGIDSQVAALKIVSLKELDREEEAMDLALTYIEDYELGEALQMYLLLAKNDPELAEIKVKQRLFAGGGEEMIWNTMLGRIMEFKKDYSSALEYFKKVERLDKKAFIYNEIANCYYMLGDTENALKYIDAATIMDDGEEYRLIRDNMLINSGKASQVIDEKMMGVELIKNVTALNGVSERLTLAELLIQDHEYSQAATIIEPLLVGLDATYRVMAPTKVMAGGKFKIEYVLEGGDGNGTSPSFPNVNGSELLNGPSVSTSMSMTVINGKTTTNHSQVFTMLYEAVTPGKYTIGPATVNVNGMILRTSPTTIEIVPSNGNNAPSDPHPQMPSTTDTESDFEDSMEQTEDSDEMDEGASALLLYAVALKGQGRDDEAKSYLQKITEIDPLPDSEIAVLAPALYELGRTDEALEKANKMALQWENYQLDPRGNEEPESCYTIATVFAQIGDSDKAIEYLEKHFQHDDFPYNFGFMERDWRLDSVRELPQYKTLVEKYKNQWKNNTTSNNK